MPTYEAPLRDLKFLLQHVLDYETAIAALDGGGETSLELAMAVLDSAATFAQEVVLPINLPGDDAGCGFDAGRVSTPPGYRRAYQAYREGGWPGLAADPAHGGQGLPPSLGLMVREFVASGSMAFGMYAGLSQGAYRALAAHGSDALKETYLSKLASGVWTGTMCMTEADGGSDLAHLRTKAEPAGDGSYRVSGTKIFISAGEHDLAENIVHLVLARLPGAPEGTRGISLFVVPKLLPASGAPNDVSCGSIEHKMGIRASATAVLHFDGARGWLLGKEHGGMQAMFTMMNSSRVGVAVQSVGAAETSYQNALAYAKERRQGKPPGAPRDEPGPLPIIGHPDVRKALLTMKALVEGARAMYVEAAMALDARASHPDADQRALADEQLALFTPVIKAFISDCALQVTELGIQVFGGHGYVHEHGMEQLYRDARIVPLYEGTNAIQALDLVHRKIGLNGGRALASFLARLDAVVAAAGGPGGTAPALAAGMTAALARVRRASALLGELSVAAAHGEMAAAASDYLRLFGLVAMGGAWLRMATAADALLARDASQADYLRGKIKTAEFFAVRLLPETEQLFQRISAGGAVLMAVGEEEF